MTYIITAIVFGLYLSKLFIYLSIANFQYPLVKYNDMVKHDTASPTIFQRITIIQNKIKKLEQLIKKSKHISAFGVICAVISLQKSIQYEEVLFWVQFGFNSTLLTLAFRFIYILEETLSKYKLL